MSGQNTAWQPCISRWRDEQGRHFVAAREVCLNEDGSVASWTEKPVHPSGDSWQAAFLNLAEVASYIGRPVLDLSADPPRMISWSVANRDD